MAAGPINTVEEAFEDPGVQATGIVKTMEHPQAGEIKLLDKPWHLSASAGGLRMPPPAPSTPVPAPGCSASQFVMRQLRSPKVAPSAL